MVENGNQTCKHKSRDLPLKNFKNRRSNSMKKLLKPKLKSERVRRDALKANVSKYRMQSKLLKTVRNNSLIRNIENVQRNWQTNDSKYVST
jgi:hypothetical protein